MWIQLPFQAICPNLPELHPQYAMHSHSTMALLSYVPMWRDFVNISSSGDIPHQDLAPMASFL